MCVLQMKQGDSECLVSTSEHHSACMVSTRVGFSNLVATDILGWLILCSGSSWCM